jgi:flagellar motor switch protein FliN/FliY
MSTTTPILIDEVRGHLNRCNLHASGQTLVVGSVRFDGDVTGIFHIHVTAAFARTLASRMLGLTEAELEGDEMVNDVMGELTNMVVGGVKSRFCDAGATCVLSTPTITRTDCSRIERQGQTERRLMSFRCGADQILVEFLMKTDLLTWR